MPAKLAGRGAQAARLVLGAHQWCGAQGVVRVALNLDGGDRRRVIRKGAVTVDVRGLRVAPDLVHEAAGLGAPILEQPEPGFPDAGLDPRQGLANRLPKGALVPVAGAEAGLEGIGARDVHDRRDEPHEERRRVDGAVVADLGRRPAPLRAQLLEPRPAGGVHPLAADRERAVFVVDPPRLLLAQRLEPPPLERGEGETDAVGEPDVAPGIETEKVLESLDRVTREEGAVKAHIGARVDHASVGGDDLREPVQQAAHRRMVV